MRLAMFSRTLLQLALPVVLATSAIAQDHPNINPAKVRDQLAKQAPGASQPQPAAPKVPAAKPAAAPMQSQAPAKSATPGPAKASQQPKAPPTTSTKPPTSPKPASNVTSQKPAEDKATLARRDPFGALLNKPGSGN